MLNTLFNFTFFNFTFFVKDEEVSLLLFQWAAHRQVLKHLFQKLLNFSQEYSCTYKMVYKCVQANSSNLEIDNIWIITFINTFNTILFNTN